MDRIAIGTDAEERATLWLQEQGLVLMQKNARCRLGEIDLIMRDEQTLVFVEVRQRRNRDYGGAAASVDWRKQLKIIRTARYLIAGNPRWSSLTCRFDVIAFEGDQEPVWYKDAFRA